MLVDKMPVKKVWRKMSVKKAWRQNVDKILQKKCL